MVENSGACQSGSPDMRAYKTWEPSVAVWSLRRVGKVSAVEIKRRSTPRASNQGQQLRADRCEQTNELLFHACSSLVKPVSQPVIQGYEIQNECPLKSLQIEFTAWLDISPDYYWNPNISIMSDQRKQWYWLRLFLFG